MPKTKPTVIPNVVAMSVGAAKISGTSSTATADSTMPAAKCCIAETTCTGTLTDSARIEAMSMIADGNRQRLNAEVMVQADLSATFPCK